MWRDTADLWPGEDWRVKIRRAITDNALVFIACFSSQSIARKKTYQNEELLLAIEQLRLRHPGDPWLIPVRFDDCAIPDLEIGGGRTLASIQRADLFGERRDTGIARLVAAVLRILGQRSDSSIRDQPISARLDISTADESGSWAQKLFPTKVKTPNKRTDRPAAATLDDELAREQVAASLDPEDISFIAKAETEGTFRHLGIVLTAIAVTCSFIVRLNNSQYRTDSGREKYEAVAAGDGAKFVSVKMRVLNDSKKGIDLTCGYPIKNHLIDERDREFTPIRELYRVQGNPGCNDMLQPGFSSDMTYIYRVPVDANISALMFEDMTDLSRDRTIEATRIPLMVPAPRAAMG